MTDDVLEIHAADAAEWRAWLEANHDTQPAVWLVFYKQNSGKPSVTWSEAVDQALCFGWVDSKVNRIDDERYKQYFTPRKPKSTWSKINKDKIEELTAAGLMREPGLRAIEIAKENGWWTILDGPEAGVVPEDLERELAAVDGAREGFDALSFSQRKAILTWLVMAVRPETRAKRIAKTVEAAARGESPIT